MIIFSFLSFISMLYIHLNSFILACSFEHKNIRPVQTWRNPRQTVVSIKCKQEIVTLVNLATSCAIPSCNICFLVGVSFIVPLMLSFNTTINHCVVVNRFKMLLSSNAVITSYNVT